MGKVNADLHTHLRTRADISNLDFNQVIDLARERLGPGGILGVVNFADRHYEQFVGKRGYERHDLSNGVYVPEKKVLVVKGEEVATKQGHLLVLGIRKNRHLAHDRTLDDTIREAKQGNGIMIADHPFTYFGIGKQLERVYNIGGKILSSEYLEKLDAIEVHNGEASLSPRNPNKKAQEFFRRMRYFNPKLGALIVSDGHSLKEVGISYTTLEMPDYETITSPYLLVDHLRKAIQNHRDFSGKMTGARFMAILHLLAIMGDKASSKARQTVQYVARKFKK